MVIITILKRSPFVWKLGQNHSLSLSPPGQTGSCSEHSHGHHLIQLFLSPSLAFLALLGAKSHLREPFLWEAPGKCGGTLGPVSPHSMGCAFAATMGHHVEPSETPSPLHLFLTKNLVHKPPRLCYNFLSAHLGPLVPALLLHITPSPERHHPGSTCQPLPLLCQLDAVSLAFPHLKWRKCSKWQARAWYTVTCSIPFILQHFNASLSCLTTETSGRVEPCSLATHSTHDKINPNTFFY